MISETPSYRESGGAVPQRDSISWETDVHLATNPLVVKQLMVVALGSGLFMAFLLSFILATTGDFQDIPTILLISLLAAGGLALLLLLVTLVFFGNRMRVRFTLDDQGALWETVDKRARTLNRIAMVAGLLGRSPQAAGAGALAASREKEFVRWHDLSAITLDERRRMITLRSSWRPVMMLVCLPSNYESVVGYVNESVLPTPETARPGRKPLGRALLRTALVTIAAAPLFTLSSYPLELDLLLPLILFLFALATVWLIPLFGWVVIGCTAILTVQVTWIGFAEFGYLYGYEQMVFVLTYAGLAYLAWFSWRSARGKARPLLMEA